MVRINISKLAILPLFHTMFLSVSMILVKFVPQTQLIKKFKLKTITINVRYGNKDLM